MPILYTLIYLNIQYYTWRIRPIVACVKWKHRQFYMCLIHKLRGVFGDRYEGAIIIIDLIGITLVGATAQEQNRRIASTELTSRSCLNQAPSFTRGAKSSRRNRRACQLPSSVVVNRGAGGVGYWPCQSLWQSRVPRFERYGGRNDR